ncbi:hypothetical protein RB597_009048 [Gaeumannomyces tritici]
MDHFTSPSATATATTTATANAPSCAGDGSASATSQGPQAKMTYACESCRAAKVKCTSSRQPGICRRCLESKRECVFKTGPRTRRPRLSKQTSAAERPPPPPGPSKTFTIDVPLPKEEHLEDPLAVLRDSHEAYIDKLMPSPPYDGDFFDDAGSDMAHGGAWSSSTRTAASATTPSSTGHSAATTNATTTTGGFSSVQPSAEPLSPMTLGLRRPQFNLDSATALLAAFRRSMDPYFPVAAVSEHDTVSSLARDRPFVLLAVLAAASGARVALRGGRGSLYDEEFRKVLGLKFVAGGERTVELLVGLLVYCAWYPVHLRPKSKQASQYMRMAVDLVQDLELDQPEGIEQAGFAGEERLQAIRAYLCCYYLVVARAMAYIARPASLQFTAWTAACCDILEREGTQASDRVLPWLVRNQHLVEETASLTAAQEKGQRSQYQVDTMLRGLEAQFREWKSRIPEDVAKTPVMLVSSLSTEIYLYSSHLWKPSLMKAQRPGHALDPNQDPVRLALALPTLRTFLEFLASITREDTPQPSPNWTQAASESTAMPLQTPSTAALFQDGGDPPAAPDEEFANFSTVEWARVVFAVVVCFRLSFDMPTCPLWDGARGRRELELGRFLAIISGDCDDFYDEIISGGSASNAAAVAARINPHMNVVCATKLVFSVVKRKFERRVAQLPPAEVPAAAAASTPVSPPVSSPTVMSMFLGGFGAGSAGGGFFGGGNGVASGNPHAAMTSDMRVGLDKSMRGCPMLDGSFDNFIPLWGDGSAAPAVPPDHPPIPMGMMGGSVGGGVGGLGNANPMADLDSSSQAAIFQDLWTTMNNEWSYGGPDNMTF